MSDYKLDDFLDIIGESIKETPTIRSRDEIIKILENIIDLEGLHFYVFGGSQHLLDISNEFTNNSDIDFFFPTEEDYKEMLKRVIESEKCYFSSSKFSDHTSLNGFELQLINYKFGDHHYHFDEFDLNKSKIGFEYINGELIDRRGDDYEDELYIIYEKFNVQTANRYIKYFFRCYDNNHLEDLSHSSSYKFLKDIEHISSYLISNENIKYISYNNNFKIGYQILESLVRILVNDSEISSKCIDIILEEMKKKWKISKVINFWKIFYEGVINNYNSLHKDEIYAVHPSLHSKVSTEFKNKFPQYFI